MNMTNNMSRGQLVVYDFGQTDLAASQSDVQLFVASSETAGTVDSVVAPWSGDIIGLGYTLSAAGSAGVMTVGPTIDGTETAAYTLSVGTTTEGDESIPRRKLPFSAGANIGAEITTDGSWNGTTSDLSVQVYVRFRLEGI